ncbi:MAG: Na+/H+ antiporter NhaC [candidate division KSB1 bacterium]|nr:Na+/H+ antiporter NhaC [candidate division KSB1 bacterium]MDZ7335999.1 Na+/H+ antiporter NhaC [candidate division KSB1 bacterium]MDZ7358708.1 Na+/H+ antiporter NhaC [candidate division KSB1 bacterium]MDZ7375299.1 Na+/H+ antiporter NhaC [candidate division KSB1 bacterium]MDZ7402013.1 Na+/H+ antiporter NhaC [candidate division KSB1 bacterium]
MTVTTKHRSPTLFEAFIPVILLMFFLAFSIIKFGSTPHIPLIGGTAVAGLMAMRLGFRWSEIEEGLINGISLALKACLILMVIGTLIGTWILSGIVPTMIYWGLKVLSPAIFLVTTCLICCLVSLATGSSWSTAGTVGIALIGVGRGLGVPLPMVAGAIISGAYFGDKMSPLSDTTNLAPAMAGTDLFTHVRHMIYTTAPSLTIAMIIYAFLGLRYAGSEIQAENVATILSTLNEHFNLHPLLLIPPCLVIVMVITRMPALPALLAGSILGGVCALIFQKSDVGTVIHVAFSGYESKTGFEMVDSLLTRGGMESMLSTVALIMCALSFGGVMEKSRMLERIAATILKAAKNTGLLVTATITTCLSMNIIAPDQYLSIVVPGRMYKDAFEKRGLHPKNLSRCLEDAGTLSSPLVPWNTCGAFMFATLGIHPFAYLPFAFLNLINPFVSIFYGFTGITMHKIEQTNSHE